MARGMTLRFRRTADTVPHVRGLVGGELGRQGVAPDVVERLVLASAEACNNAILHSASPTYRVTVEVDGSVCTITVADDGRGFEVPDRVVMPGPDAVGRRGLALMDALVDDVDVRSSDSGTTVRISHALDGARSAPVRV